MLDLFSAIWRHQGAYTTKVYNVLLQKWFWIQGSAANASNAMNTVEETTFFHVECSSSKAKYYE